MKKSLFVLPLSLLSCLAVASEEDVSRLQKEVDSAVLTVESTGLLPTHTEIEQITCDIVADKVINGEVTTKQAAEKYELDPIVERCVAIKFATKSSGDNGQEPPK